MIDSVCRKDENCYLKVFLEKYNIITIKEKISVFNDNVEIHSDDSDEDYSHDSYDSDRKS